MSRLPALVFVCAALAAGTVAFAAPQIGKWGVDLTAIDPAVRPGDNFFDHVNGKWLATIQIPPDRSSIGSFQQLQILSEQRLQTIIGELKAKPEAALSPEEKKLRDLYDSFEDTDAIEAAGLKPAQKDIDYFSGLKTKADVARAMASVPLSTFSIYNIGIGVDDKHPDNYSVNLSQGGIGLPDRDYYLSDDKALVATREAYRKYLADMMTLAGMSDAAARADRVLALETEIAKVQWNRADRRDADKVYNPMPVSQLKTLAPDFPWDAFLSESHIPLTARPGERQVIVAENTAFGPLAKVFAATPLSTWRDYLTVHYLHTFSAYLPKKFDDTDFAFYGTVLTGRPQQLDRKTRGVHLLDNLMGEALGKIYVARYFPPEAKAKADQLVSNLLKAYEADIQTLSWMTPATRAKALDKLHQFTPKIGYPTKWRDYSPYQVSRSDLIANVQGATVYEWNRDVARINQPVDKSEWGMTPSTINAYYNPSFNEIVFPAAILQPPFFDPEADDAVNYGAIGAVIGHEISHGFDDQGSKYDGKGVFQDWWSAQDRANFDARTKAIVDQYDSYEPLPGLHVIGKNTLGENIADNAGLAIAYKAYHIALGGNPAPILDGYGGDQRFFLSFGQVWRSKYRESALRTQTLSNEHTVAEFRVIGTVRNMDAWYDAFQVTPDQKYYLAPDARVHLWVGRGQGLAFAALLLLAAPAADNAWADPEHMLVPGQYDPLEVLPPPPAPGSPKAAAEIAELKRTQAAATPAQMAAAAYDDAHEDGTIFAAALGPGYDMARLPATATLLHVVIRNEAHLSASAKAAFHRDRPWIVDPSIHTCTPHGDGSAANAYPSGHSSVGYAMATVLAALMPRKAAPILARAHVFAENRIVCGYHVRSDIAAGQTYGTYVAHLLLKAPDFQPIYQAAETELKAAHMAP